jgi:SepF-like predicted cell division protein (DUF552 family)
VREKRYECLKVLLKYNAVFDSNDEELPGDDLQWYEEQKTRIETENRVRIVRVKKAQQSSDNSTHEEYNVSYFCISWKNKHLLINN